MTGEDYSELSIDRLKIKLVHHPYDTEARFYLGWKLFLEDQYEEASKELERVVDEEPIQTGARLVLSSVYWHLDRLEEANNGIREVLDMEPENAKAWHDIGINMFGERRYRLAEEYLRKSLGYDDTRPSTWMFLGDTLRESERVKESGSCYLRALLLDEDYFYALRGMGEYYLELSEFEDAKKVLVRASELEPENTYTLVLLGEVQFLLRELEDAERTLTIVVETKDENTSSALSLLGQVLFWARKTERAEECLILTLMDDDAEPVVWETLGRIQLLREEYSKAEKSFNIAIGQDRYLADSHELLAQTYAAQGRTEDERVQRKVMYDLFEKETPFVIPYKEIDPSIRNTIRELNALGLTTGGCCSGLEDEHEHADGDMRWNPYVSFFADGPGHIHHLFTIADMAGWKSDYGVNGHGVEVRLEGLGYEELRIRWDLLIDSARFVMERIATLGNSRIE